MPALAPYIPGQDAKLNNWPVNFSTLISASDDGRTVHHPAELLLNDREQKVLDVVRCEATSIDEIVMHSGLRERRSWPR